MNDAWERKTLFDAIELQRGFDLPASNRQSGEVPVVASTSVVGSHSESKVDGPGVVIGRSGSIGGAQWIDKDFWPLNTTLWVKDFRGNDPLFVYHLLKSIDFSAFNVGSGVPTLNRNHLSGVKVSLPPLADQRRIAGVLGALDDLIEVNRTLIQGIDELGLAQLMAALPVSLQEVDGCDSTDGWSVSTIEEMSSVLETGGRPKGGVASIRSGIPSVGAESINGLANFDFTKVKYVPEDFFLSMKKGHVASGDVLVYKDGGTPGSFTPKVAQYGEGFPFRSFAINEHVFRVRVKAPVSNAFLYFWLKSDRMMAEMHRAGTGAAIPGINKTAFGGLPLAVPPTEVATTLCPALDVLSSSALELANEMRELSDTRDELLPLLMSGRVRVAEEVAA